MLRIGNPGLIQPPMKIDMFIILYMLNRFKDKVISCVEVNIAETVQ